ncbi:MAG TPA: BT_3928 family protein [Bacteroidales bacterium]|nr:BT_3928 family protein [Bacteroidales bacterium]
MMKTIRLISRVLLGIVFIFSGFVKGIDTQGFSIKLSEYLEAFGMPEMEALTLILAVLASVAEMIIGVSLFIGLRMKLTAWAGLIFMSFFTILTLYIAIANPVTDCGCFGDAIKLSNWGTFYKNIVLIALAIVVFWQRDKYLPMFHSGYEWAIISAYTIAIAFIFIYCINHLPIIDFRPYHVGADIKANMEVPAGAPSDEYKITHFYKKNGEVKQFPDTSYPWDDSTWTWVETKRELIKKGYEPPIHDFSITTETGTDITDSIVNSSSYTFLLVSTELAKSDKEGMIQASALAEESANQGYGFYCLTASPFDFAASYKKAYNLKFPFCSTDKTTLKTIIRSNPGLVLLKEGVVIGQWHYNDFPGVGFVKKNMMAQQVNNMRVMDNNKMNMLFISLFLLSIAILSLIKRIK